MPELPARRREVGTIRRGLLWLALLAPFFFASYGFANWYASQQSEVPSLVFSREHAIPLWPWTIVPYWSIDLLYGLAFLLPLSRKGIDRLGLRLLSVQLLCIGCFLIWPLKFSFERPPLDGVFGGLFDLLMGFDKPFNQAPSLHIALLVVLWSEYSQRAKGAWRYLLHGWFALIGLSVLTTWQHHFIDLPTGLAAGLFCLWLWPRNSFSRLSLAREPRRLKLAAAYGVGAVLLLLAAMLWPMSLLGMLLFWLALALAMVALNYLLFAAAGFQKSELGHPSFASRWLLLPYRLFAWLNIRFWTGGQVAAQEVLPGVWLGRMPTMSEAQQYDAILDLCAELPFPYSGKALLTPARGMTEGKLKWYQPMPMLDLCLPDEQDCLEAVRRLECLRTSGTLLVCCALGYGRSALVLAAWLLLSGRAGSALDAAKMIAAVRPKVVFKPETLAYLERLKSGFCPPEVQHA